MRDVIAVDAFYTLQSDPDSVLVDVRTREEWAADGIPDLSSMNKKVLLMELRSVPDMALNKDFATNLRLLIPESETVMLFLCRSGVRSSEAASIMHALGYDRCYNVISGFMHKENSWMHAALPWMAY